MKEIRLAEWTAALRSWADRQPRLPLVAGGAALFLLGWALYAPALISIRKANVRLNELRTQMNETRGMLDLVRAGQVRLLAKQESIPHLLEKLNVQARECGVNLAEITPGKADSRGSALLVILPVEMQIEGAYRAVGEFLGTLRSEPAFGVVTVRSLRMGREERLLPRLRARLSIEIALNPTEVPHGD